MNKSETLNTLNLIQGYYRFLYLSSFLEDVVKHNDLSQFAVDVPINTGLNTTFTLKGQTIKKILKEIYDNPDKPNILGHFTKIIVFKEITSGIRELIENSLIFRKFLIENFQGKYFEFEQIIKLTRNVLSHSTSSNIILKKEDFEKQKTFLLYTKKPVIEFDFKYSTYLPKYWKGNENYGFNIKINFTTIREGEKFFNIISEHSLFMLAELCYNLGEIFKNKNKKK